MKLPASLSLLLALCLLAGCASQNEGTRPGLAPSDYAHEDSRVGTVSKAASGQFRSSPPSPTERPGLGTSWGEHRESHVGLAGFTRARSTNPDGIGRLFYNDKEGIRAMLATVGSSSPVSPPMRTAYGLVSIWLKDGSGRWLPGSRASNEGFIIGERGERYEIYLRNECRARVEVVTSVDGLDVMDGKPASYRKRGYLLDPGESVQIDGFRTGLDSVAAFRFGAVSDSYSALKHGTTRNVGVIGAAVFVEKGASPWTTEAWERREADPFPNKKWATAP